MSPAAPLPSATRTRSSLIALALCLLAAAALLAAAPAAHAAGSGYASLIGGPYGGLAGRSLDVYAFVPGQQNAVPTGTVTVTLYASSDTTCSAPVATASGPLSVDDNYANSAQGTFTLTAPAAPGTYIYVLTYSGDDVYYGYTNNCDTYKHISVAPNPSTPTTQLSTSFAHLGDGVTLSTSFGADDAPAPTGDVTFRLYPLGSGCTGTPTASSAPATLTADGDGGHAAADTDFTTVAAGTYDVVADYAGDVSWSASHGPCSDASLLTVADGLTDPGLQSSLSSSVTDVGNPIYSTNTVTAPAHYPDPTGQIVETWYGPGISDCTGAPRSVAPQAIGPFGFDQSGTGSTFGSADRGVYSVISSYEGDANYLPGTGTCQTFTVRGPSLDLSASGLSFASADAAQQVGTIGPAQTVTITNNGDGTVPLTIDGFTFSGPDSDDFLIGSSTCGGQIRPTGSCTFTVRFTPQAAGARSARLVVLAGDVPSVSVDLSGTAGALNALQAPGLTGLTGPAGPAGPAGSNGTNGANGAAGKPGADGRQGATGPAGVAGTPASSAPALNLLCGNQDSGCRVQFRTPARFHLITARLVDRRGHATLARFVSKGRVLLDAHHRPLRLRGGTYRVTIRLARTARWTLVRHYRLTVTG